METQTQINAPVVSPRPVKMDQRRQSRRAWALWRFKEDELKKAHEALSQEKKKKGGDSAKIIPIEAKLKEIATLKGRVGNYLGRTFDEHDSPPQGKRK